MWGLSNREVATLIWILGFLAFAFMKSDFRDAFAKVIRAFMHLKVIGSFVGFVLYVTFFVWLLAELGIWNTSLLKDTIIWWLLSGTVLLVRALEKSKNPQFFRETVLELFSVNAFLALYFELHSFSLVVELFLQPLLVALMLLITVGRTDAKHARVVSCLSYVSLIVFVNMLLLTGWYLVRNFSSVNPIEVLGTFSLPIVLTVIALPFVFAFALVAEYEFAFMRMSFRIGRNPVPWKVRFAVMKTFRGDLHALGSMGARCTATIARTTTYREAISESQKCKVRQVNSE